MTTATLMEVRKLVVRLLYMTHLWGAGNLPMALTWATAAPALR